MGKLITITGVSGVGKTTLACKLGKVTSLPVYTEEHSERPFHTAAASDRSAMMLANQLDFLLYRAEQERVIRTSDKAGITDGGLETDFLIFTKLFHQRGLLTEAGYDLCRRFYELARSYSPPPDLIVYLRAPLGVIKERFLLRHRTSEVSQIDDLAIQQHLIEGWLAVPGSSQMLIIDADKEDSEYSKAIVYLLPMVVSDGL
jgi:deoxyadenosine/deoxycytidine kinase